MVISEERFSDGSGFQGDIRFKHYADALRAGDLETCERIRTHHQHDVKLMTRLRTLEQVWLTEMNKYVREIQICRRERDGYRALATGVTAAKKRGKALLQQATEARETHEEVELPQGFPGV